MPRSEFLNEGTRVLAGAFLLTALFASGVAAGLWFYPAFYSVATDEEGHADGGHKDEHHHDDEDHDEHDEEDHVALTKQAFENLRLRLDYPTKRPYWKSTLVPGKVVEIPGRSDLTASTPVAGVIESVNVVPGQTIPLDEPLFKIRLTDEALLVAQAKYLETLTQQEVAEQEIERLTPLINSGAVPGSKKRELEYEVKQLVAKQTTILQELRGRGIPDALIDELRQNRTLASTLSVFAPGFVSGPESQEVPSGYSVENLLVHPGKAVVRGESLCTIAYHQQLYIEGTAFEADLPILRNITEKGWMITAETVAGHDKHSHSSPLQLRLLRVDNHVDDATQTVRFFLELPNEVTQKMTEEGRYFEQWRYRPGQRLHLRLPVEKWENPIALPADAVVIDGPNSFVFAEHDHGYEHRHDHKHPHTTDQHDVFAELKPVPVHVLHRDDQTVIVADDGQLDADDRIAFNSAYKLYLAMKMQAGGGGGHHHDH